VADSQQDVKLTACGNSSRIRNDGLSCSLGIFEDWLSLEGQLPGLLVRNSRNLQCQDGMTIR
jgi:hypothetical protein